MGLTRPRYNQLVDSDYKQSVRLATTTDVGNLLASGSITNSVDGYQVAVGDRILVKNQNDSKQNGIYFVSNVGTGNNGDWIRTTDANSNESVTFGLTTTISSGTTNAGTTWKLTTPDPIVLGTTALTFTNASASQGVVSSYGDANVASYLTAYTGTFGNLSGITSNGTIQTSGNITAGNIYTPGSLTTGTSTTYSVAITSNPADLAGSINVGGGLKPLQYGASNHRWYVSGYSKLYLDTTALSVQTTTESTSKTTGALVVSGGVGVSGNITAGNVTATYLYGTASNTTGFKNRIINGGFAVSQRGSGSQVVVAGTTVPTVSTGYQIDRWFCYSVGANVSIAQSTVGTVKVGQITGAASVTNVGIGQRIEMLNSIDLAGQNATLTFSMSNSLLTTTTLTISYATNADTFGTIAAPTKTTIATQNFTISATLTQFTYTFAVPAAATTGLEFLFTVGAQTSGTWNIGLVQLEQGIASTTFEIRSIQAELLLCQRYLEVIQTQVFRWSGYNATAASSANYTTLPMQVTKRVTPSTVMNIGVSNLSSLSFTASTTGMAVSGTNTAAGNWYGFNNALATINAEL